MELNIKNLDHLGIIAGVIDEMGLVETIDQAIPPHPDQILSTGTVVKAMILNGLGFVSAPLYMFERFFTGKPIAHLLGQGVEAKHLNDDRLSRALDALWETGISQLFTKIAMKSYEVFAMTSPSVHLDSTSISVEGEYAQIEEGTIHITHGYSRDKRPDLKQFLINLICSSDGDVPLFLRVGDGNESDRAEFAKLLSEFQQEWNLDSTCVADSALYSQDNIIKLSAINWITRVPSSIKAVTELIDNVPIECFSNSNIEGYSFAECCNNYGGIQQRWLLIESEERKKSDLIKWRKELGKHRETAQKELTAVLQQDFFCEADAREFMHEIDKQWQFHQISSAEIVTISHYKSVGRPKKNQTPDKITYRIQAVVSKNQASIEKKEKTLGKWVLATNVVDDQKLSNQEILDTYKVRIQVRMGMREMEEGSIKAKRKKSTTDLP